MLYENILNLIQISADSEKRYSEYHITNFKVIKLTTHRSAMRNLYRTLYKESAYQI